MRYQIPLLLRFRVFRGLLMAVFIVGFAAGGFKTTADALKLSPEQEAEKLLGGADAVVESRPEEGASNGTYPQPPEQLAASGITVTAEYSSSVDLAQGDEARRFDYSESPLPSVVSDGRYELLKGAWPTRPGECIGSSFPHGEWSSTHQQWSIRVVGAFKEVYSHAENSLVCAPGTWGERAGKGDSTEEITANYWLVGPPEELQALKDEIGFSGEDEPVSMILRADLLKDNGASAQRFLGGYSLVLALLAGIPFVFAGMVARWVRGIQQVLVCSGIRPQVMLRAAVTTLLGGVVVLAVAGCGMGMLTGLAARPLVQQANQGLPLGPWQFSLPWVGQTVLWSVAGALLGFVVLGAFQQVRARLAERAPWPLSPTMATALGWAGLGLWGFAIWSLVTSSGKVWPMSLGVIFAVLGMVALAPRVVVWGSGVMAKPPVSSRDLAARLLREDGARWAGVSAVVTLLIGLVFSVFINISASFSAQVLLLAPRVPEGMVLLQTSTPGGERLPDEVIAKFEQDNQSHAVATLTNTNFGVEGEGTVQVFDTVEEATAVLGLTPAQATAMTSGAVLKLGGTNEEITLVNLSDPSQTVQTRVVGFKPEAPARLNTGYAFGLRETIPVPEEEAGVFQVHTGLTPEQAAAMEQWPITSGHGDVILQGRRPGNGASVPLWLSIGFTGIALLAVPLLVWTLQREVQALSPLAQNLTAMGLPHQWARRVLAGVIGPVLVIPLALGLLAGMASTALLHWLYPPVFDLAGINYLGLAVFTIALLLAGTLAVRLGVHQLHSRKRGLVV